MVEALNLPRDTSRNPLVQVMLQLIELPDASPSGVEGLEVETLSANSATAKVDLNIHLHRSADGGLRGTLNYATDLFSTDRIQRLSTHLTCLLYTSDAADE